MGARSMDKDAFARSLEPKDFAIASNMQCEKLHIVVLKVSAQDSGNMRDDADLDLTYWRAKGVCGTLGVGYFWNVWQEHYNAETLADLIRHGTLCKTCVSKWKSMGRPKIRGYTDRAGEDKTEIYVPAGWKEVDPVGHENDAEYEYNDEPYPLIEERRWVRGGRYVRLVSIDDDKDELTHGVFYGWTDDPGTDSFHRFSNKVRCMESIEDLLRQGGYP